MNRILIAVLKPFSFVPAILMMCLIFSFSSQNGAESSALSVKVTRALVVVADRVLDRNWSPEEIEARVRRFEYPVRKLAHMGEYCLLAISLALPLYVYGLRGFPLLLLVCILCAAFAATDEYHQSLVDNRGPSVRDVGIDCFGSLIGVIFVRFFSWVALGGRTRPARRR